MSETEWEEVCLEEGLTLVERLRVPSGWLYRTIFLGGAGAVCFVPEAESKTTKRQRCKASLCKEHIGALQETIGEAVLEREAAEKERDEATAKLRGYQSAPAHVAADVLRSRLRETEKERDAARSELAVVEKERDTWIHDHGLMFVEIQAHLARIATLEANNE